MTFDDPKKTWRFLAKVTHYIYCSTALVYLYLRQVVVMRSQPEELIESYEIEYKIRIGYIIIHLEIRRQIRYVLKFDKYQEYFINCTVFLWYHHIRDSKFWKVRKLTKVRYGRKMWRSTKNRVSIFGIQLKIFFVVY